MELAGIYVPLVTPFTTGGDVAYDALEALAHSVLDAGAAGVVALGTTGEPATLDESERARVVAVCARACRERDVALIVGAGTNDTRRTAEALRALDAHAALVTVPYFTRPSEAGVVAHFRHVAQSGGVPLIVYNIPYRTAQPLSAACLRELAALPGVVGVKQSAGCVDQCTVDLLADTPPGLAVLAGDDAFAPALLALGAHGGILASAHLHTAAFVELDAAWRRGDAHRARALGDSLAPLAKALFAEPNPTVLKGVLHAQGRIPTPDVRLPLLPASAAAVTAAVRAAEAVPDAVG
ncbi:4-hydroxy-tetrahydrodipicolinate synthase [Saccharopolyspora erythraea NRRL 2338]|uniref:4-hydroxy-tetrahydrodipicolinate synthase n=2 Tax=Saccharopolyspora erythraea TaxID=1836 RepID=A4FA73_SACEN|nr:4-hydroxy-tetrahydrodipicolinate synthase [Saccharopolyspora erythraea]EQD83420.1 dihydrodipicolinate synthase [Saccharopolyspora erythraea D]PFG94734.1 4-hydroxy-tetrahydrodipicolinate synthase [Saccharopolyspora erythraea NRRL 2338]QRK91456.1 4-hydroxy-tetrahydrodipicolinate synthase [Saccharopolyspora erythraea]CAM00948.1 dihydrodipicolinate synthase [Saccharopolyspora erythraea NRRL 2338]